MSVQFSRIIKNKYIIINQSIPSLSNFKACVVHMVKFVSITN